jgi:multicomponent Na+:H+ antiporter subunit D
VSRGRTRPAAHEAPLAMALPAGLLVAATMYFGLDTSFTVGSAAQAAEHAAGGRR